jgi:hypothetical protein
MDLARSLPSWEADLAFGYFCCANSVLKEVCQEPMISRMKSHGLLYLPTPG